MHHILRRFMATLGSLKVLHETADNLLVDRINCKLIAGIRWQEPFSCLREALGLWR
jgi:hypothetical protein